MLHRLFRGMRMMSTPPSYVSKADKTQQHSIYATVQTHTYVTNVYCYHHHGDTALCIHNHHHGNTLNVFYRVNKYITMVTVYVYYCTNTCITVVIQYFYIIVLTYISVEQYGILYTVQIFLLHYCDITISLRYELKEHFQLY